MRFLLIWYLYHILCILGHPQYLKSYKELNILGGSADICPGMVNITLSSLSILSKSIAKVNRGVVVDVSYTNIFDWR